MAQSTGFVDLVAGIVWSVPGFGGSGHNSSGTVGESDSASDEVFVARFDNIAGETMHALADVDDGSAVALDAEPDERVSELG